MKTALALLLVLGFLALGVVLAACVALALDIWDRRAERRDARRRERERLKGILR